MKIDPTTYQSNAMLFKTTSNIANGPLANPQSSSTSIQSDGNRTISDTVSLSPTIDNQEDAQQALHFIQSSVKSGEDLTGMHTLSLDRVLELIG